MLKSSGGKQTTKAQRCVRRLDRAHYRAAVLCDNCSAHLKIDEMQDRIIEVTTRQGVTTIPYEVGLFQGSMWSVVLANLVTALKFKVWERVCDVGYTLQKPDDRDNENPEAWKIWAAGYCDDNTRVIGIPDQRKVHDDLARDGTLEADAEEIEPIRERRRRLRWLIA